MKWSNEANDALSRVPFFVRKRVKRRVEAEAARCGTDEVTIEHVRTCRKRFLHHMEDEVKGFQVETCFGPGGCPNRAVNSNGLPERVENRLSKRNMKSFLRERVNGSLKMHHEFRISVSDCPNACSRPQIFDVGLIGACRPEVTDDPCTQCGACVEACKENAISIKDDVPVVDDTKCLYCGQCIPVCPTGSLKAAQKGYRILIGGKLGRHPRLATELPGIYQPGEALAVIDRCLDHYQHHCLKGERFGEILERTPLPHSLLVSG
ncbi:MAG: 4Fe-4S binding protein [Deltaproteobacteria bacterium]|nr:4Fe-4S binding protein [Deltaproteobacteria bacterium]MBW2208732.1 4Fe-4S binding protein [Deltaproteobacteria bacterium]